MSKSANPRIIRLSVAIIQLGIAYGLGSWAIDTASWLLYLLTFILVIASLYVLVKMFKNETG